MKTKYLKTLTILFILCFSSAIIFSFPNIDETSKSNASLSKYELGKRYLKLGNTYREAKDYDNALKYIQKGQNVFKKQNNLEEKYWYAVSQEYLGYYYRDLHQTHNATSSLADAEQIFSDVITQEDGSQVAIGSKKIMSRQENNNKRHPFNIDKKFDLSKLNLDLKNLNIDLSKLNLENLNLDKYFNFDKHSNIDKKTTQGKQFIINLDNRNLTDFPGNFVGNRIDNLSMSNNQLKRLPERVNSFNTLQVLNVSRNQISVFPYLDNLKKLRYLDFSNNQLTEIDASIRNLRSLQYLNLSNNPNLNYISSEIFNLNNLEVLDITNTALPRYLIDDLIARLPNTNVIYTLTTAPATNNINLDEGDDWEDEDDDWEDF